MITYFNRRAVSLGTDTETGKPLFIGDNERRSGLYMLGKSGMGKTTLLVNLIRQDIENGHGVFFLDPHGDAITDLVKCTSVSPLIINPTDETHSFGINLLHCHDITSITERNETYARAYGLFYKLWANEWGPWLELILTNTLYVFIENQDYTLAEVPLFLINPAFRNQLLKNVKYNLEAVDFWHDEFGERSQRDQDIQLQSALTRIRTLLTQQYVKHIIGQRKTTINFSEIIEKKQVLFAKLSASLPENIKRFIGTILISELLHAVRSRIELPEEKRHQFCIFADEFQNFASTEDFGILFTEARKYGVSATISHQERFGQFADNKKISGATAASVNKVAFQLTPADAIELAPEFALPPPVEMRRERELVISQTPVSELLKGHATQKSANLPINIYGRSKNIWT